MSKSIESEPLLHEITFNDPADLPVRPTTIVFRYAPKSGNIHTASLTLPSALRKSEVMIGFVSFFYSREFKKLGLQTKSQWHTYLKRFIQFLDALDSPLSINLGHLFLNYLKKRKLKEHGIYDTMRCMKWAFTGLRKKLESEDVTIEKLTSQNYKFVVLLTEEWPSLSSPPKLPRKSMREKVYENDDKEKYSDGDFLHSLRFVLLNYLSKMQEIRHEISKNNRDIVEKARNYLLSDSPKEKLPLQKNKELGELYWMLINAAADIDNELLLDSLFFDQIVRRNTYNVFLDRERLVLLPSITRADKISVLRSAFSNRQVLSHFPAGAYFQSSRRVSVTLFSFDIKDIFAPSLTEHIALSMLLASDRIQPSNQARMTADSFVFGNNRLEICSIKRRSRRTDRVFYARNKPQFGIYEDFIKSKIEYEIEFLGKEERSAFETPIFSHKAQYQVPILTTISVRPLTLIALTNSAWNKSIRRSAGDNHRLADSFFEYWRSIIRDNERKPFSNYISLDGIARSRIYLMEERDSVISPAETTKSKNRDLGSFENSARMVGLHHSASTHHGIYRGRSKVALERQDRFAALVGKEMVESAMVLKRLVEEAATKLIPLTPSEARVRLGLDPTNALMTDDDDNIQNIIENEKIAGHVSGVFNQISLGENSIVLITPLVSELMRQYIKHIDSQINRVAHNNPERAKICAIRALTLSEILGVFPRKVISQGKKKYGHFEFPFPDLMVTLQ